MNSTSIHSRGFVTLSGQPPVGAGTNEGRLMAELWVFTAEAVFTSQKLYEIHAGKTTSSNMLRGTDPMEKRIDLHIWVMD